MFTEPASEPAPTWPAGPAGSGPTVEAWDVGRTVQEAAAARRLVHAGPNLAAVSRIVAKAARLLDAESAQVSLLTEHQTVAGRSGRAPASVGSLGPLADSLCTVTVTGKEPLIVPDALNDPRVNQLAPVAVGPVRSYLGVPMTDAHGVIVGALCVFDPTAREWTPAHVMILELLAESAVAELELAALAQEYELSRTRSNVALGVASIGTFGYDDRTEMINLDERMHVLLGDNSNPADKPLDESIKAFTGRLHPDDVDVLIAAARHSLAEVGPLEVEFRVVLPTGALRWIHLRGVTLHDSDAHSDSAGPGAAPGAATDFAGPGAARDFAGPGAAPVAATDFAGPGPAARIVGAAFDVTESRATQELLQLSLRSGEILMRALDDDRVLAEIASHVVPRLADWAIVSAIDLDGSVRDLGIAHVEPHMVATLECYAASRFEGLANKTSGPAAYVRQTRTPFITEAGTTRAALAQLRSETARDALRVLAPESTVVMPMVAGDRVVGMLGMWRGADRPPMTDQELSVAESISRRGGLALENIRLHKKQRAEAEYNRSVAHALQDAMLTRLPSVDRLQLAARYRTAAGEDNVGGDWYDVLPGPDDETVVVIGDVIGHNLDAATTMGQLRNLLRMAVVDHPGAPGATLTRLDQAIARLKLKTLATVILLTIADHPDRDRTVLRWANAGHPAPVLLHPDGTAHLLAADTDTLLGVAPDTVRHDHAHAAPPGSTLLLYTDGLVESRTRDVDEGQAQLLAAATVHHRLDTGDLLDALLTDLVGDHPSDDVALLGIRFGDL